MTKPAATPPPVRPAASIVIIRDSGNGLETFMVVRHEGANMAFSGAMVFPGGKVDDDDGLDVWQRLAPAATTKPDHPFWVAAVRETFEEAGLLLARSAPASFVTPEHTDRLLEVERTGRTGGTPVRFVDLIEREGLTLALDQMIHFGHWITPPWAPKRFDTHFFLVGAPEGQHGLVDEQESSEGLWIAPAEVLRRAEAGQCTLVPVTRFTLELLASWPNVAHALAAARQREIVTVMPKMEKTDTGRWLRIPENAGYLSTELFIAKE